MERRNEGREKGDQREGRKGRLNQNREKGVQEGRIEPGRLDARESRKVERDRGREEHEEQGRYTRNEETKRGYIA